MALHNNNTKKRKKPNGKEKPRGKDFYKKEKETLKHTLTVKFFEYLARKLRDCYTRAKDRKTGKLGGDWWGRDGPKQKETICVAGEMS